jgi:hypothetical protein
MKSCSEEEKREYNRFYRLAFPHIHREYTRVFKLAFPERRRKLQRRFRANNPGYDAAWSKAHPEVAQRYARSEKGKITKCAAWMRRWAHKRQAVLPGAQSDITDVYARAAWWRTQGFDVEVDHIFPLGFGWHEPANLQIIYASDNRQKSYKPDYVPMVVFV